MTAKGEARRPIADVIEDVEWILETDPRALARDIADRLGYRSKSGLQKALEVRPDLLARLAHNAELAGFKVRKSPQPKTARKDDAA